jgi:hypothetical protein
MLFRRYVFHEDDPYSALLAALLVSSIVFIQDGQSIGPQPEYYESVGKQDDADFGNLMPRFRQSRLHLEPKQSCSQGKDQVQDAPFRPAFLIEHANSSTSSILT